MMEWNIQSRAHACQACGQGFEDKQPYHTLLFDEKGGYQRFDVCAACWREKYSLEADRENAVSQWQGVYHKPPPAPPEAIQKQTAESLLRQLTEQNDPRHAAACYVLAVMLERKRLLKVKSQFKQDGRRVFVYEHPKSGDLFTIPDPDLQLNQLETVQRDVANLLEHGVPSGEKAEDAAPPAEEAASDQAKVEKTAAPDEQAEQADGKPPGV